MLLIEFLIFLPLILATITTVFVWRQITDRTLFFFAAVLAMLGLQQMFAPAAIFYFLQSCAGIDAANAAVPRALISASALQVIVGVPFLLWLRRAFQLPNLSLDLDASSMCQST